MKNWIKENYFYMLEQLRKDINAFQQENIISVTTERRIRNGDIDSISDRTINALVEYYNRHGVDLYPHLVDLHDFKHTDLRASTQPIWKNSDIVGEYISLHLSKRGTGKPKAMVFTIKETPSHTLEVRAIDIVQDPAKAAPLIDSILKIEDLEEAKCAHKTMFDKNKAALRGSRFLHGVASGRGNLLTMSLKDDVGYELTIHTSLKSYTNILKNNPDSYSWRGGAALATACDLDTWPSSMVIGIINLELWHPKLMNNADIIYSLQRMHSYQKKENMLALDADVDSLWYETFMDVHRQSQAYTTD